MPYVLWSPFFSVGVPELDRDHQELFTIVNEFFDHLHGEAEDELVFDTLNRLVRYAEGHFQREEAVLEAHRFPGLLKHRMEHERLLRRVFEIHALSAQGTQAIAEDVRAFLAEWLQKHIIEFDKEYAAHLADS